MTQRLVTFMSVLSLAVPAAALAQEPAPEIEIEVENPDEGKPDEAIPEPEIEIEGATPAKGKGDKDLKLGEKRVSWQDIVVVKRKPFLKNGRIELLPTMGITMNDNMIRHYQFAAQLNYWLTDALAVGAEGELFRRDLLQPYELIAVQYRRLPTLNQYNFAGSLNFHYVPIYGKFAQLNKRIIHWEVFFTAGVGFTQSEVLPRDPKHEAWTNFLITPNVGATARVFLTRFLTLNLGVRDYIFNDKFESVDRTEINADLAKENADGKLINHIVFQLGISLWFPMSFEYTTFR